MLANRAPLTIQEVSELLLGSENNTQLLVSSALAPVCRPVLNNLRHDPENEKFHSLRIRNPKIESALRFKGVLEWFQLAGFAEKQVEVSTDDGEAGQAVEKETRLVWHCGGGRGGSENSLKGAALCLDQVEAAVHLRQKADHQPGGQGGNQSSAVLSEAPPNTVWFYSEKKRNGEFSNFYAPKVLILKGRSWPTTEHYFQAMKFEHSPTDFDEVAHMATPMMSFDAGRDRSRPFRKDWNAVKDAVMYDCVLAKFTQNADLWGLLDSTGDSTLVERTKNDNYWGDGGDGTGKNMLGVILMQVRAHIRAESRKAKQVEVE